MTQAFKQYLIWPNWVSGLGCEGGCHLFWSLLILYFHSICRWKWASLISFQFISVSWGGGGELICILQSAYSSMYTGSASDGPIDGRHRRSREIHPHFDGGNAWSGEVHSASRAHLNRRFGRGVVESRQFDAANGPSHAREWSLIQWFAYNYKCG